MEGATVGYLETGRGKGAQMCHLQHLEDPICDISVFHAHDKDLRE